MSYLVKTIYEDINITRFYCNEIVDWQHAYMVY